MTEPEDKTPDFNHRHLLGLADYSAEDIGHILQQTDRFLEILNRPIPKIPTMRDVTVVNLFYEDSTRTRLSFELAEKRMGADVVNFSAKGSSVGKGESLKDTIQNIGAMKIDMVVIRHQSPGAAHYLTRCIDTSVINAGDGPHEHPTQALLDMYSMKQKFGELKGLKVAIIGDILHSRVVRSNIIGLTKMGAEVTVCGPKSMIPLFADELGAKVSYHLEETLEWCDVAMALRIQLERQEQGLFPSVREYHEQFGIKKRHLKEFPDFTIMHPGPVNRGVELESEVADSPRAIILDQVTNGLAVRMAALYLLSGRLSGQ